MALPDALAGLPKPGGTPDSLYQRCKDFTNAAAQLDDICDDFAKLLEQVPRPWAGTSQSEFSQVMSGRPRNYRKIAAGYRKAGLAVNEYASALEHAQQTWEASRQLADADWHRQIPSRDGTPPDPFSPDRVRARKQVEAAMERLRATTRRSHGVLKALEDTLDGSRSPNLPEIARGRRAAMMQAGDKVYDMGRADWDALWELHKLYLPSTAAEAWKQRFLAYVDESYRLCSDPVSYFRDMLYEYFSIDEFQSGNDARAWAGVAYSFSGGGWKFVKKVMLPEDKSKNDEKKEEQKKSSCSPVG